MMKNAQYSWLALPLLCSAALVEAANSWHGPEPFRLERFDGRQFDYNLESFLQRLSFTEQPISSGVPLWQQNGWYGTGGSSRGKEFYVHSLLQQKVRFDAPLFAGFRHKRSEDLDGWYDRALFGVGYQASTNWDLGVWGDVSGAKEEMDLQFEANRYFDDGSYLTAAVVLTDVFYNSKTYSDNRYERNPLTLYLAGAKQFVDQQLSAFININLPTEFNDATLGQLLQDEQYSAGISWQRSFQGERQLSVQGQGLYGKRRADSPLADSDADWQLTRRFAQLNLEWQQPLQQRPTALGLQLNRLTEYDSRFANATQSAESRREAFAYLRQDRSLNDNWRWRPTLYVGYGAARSELRTNSDEPLKDNGWLAKISPNLLWQLSQSSGAYLLINPTVKLHNLQFGGGNIQVFVPF